MYIYFYSLIFFSLRFFKEVYKSHWQIVKLKNEKKKNTHLPLYIVTN